MAQIALVTGATSGIGLEIARHLAAAGAVVIGTGRDEEAIRRLNNLHVDDEISFVRSDVTDLEDIRSTVKAIVETHGRISVLVNNAGRSGGGPTSTMADELWDSMMETNLTSIFRVTRECLSQAGLASESDGRIISISSTGGKQGVALAAAYCATKSGILGFTKALALELAPGGTTVNAVCPGFVETPMAQRIRTGHAEFHNISETAVKSGFEAKIPSGRYVRPEEVASMVAYIASSAAASVTGQAINVCGGLGRY